MLLVQARLIVPAFNEGMSSFDAYPHAFVSVCSTTPHRNSDGHSRNDYTSYVKQMLLRHQIEAEGVPIRNKEGTTSEAGFHTLRVHQHQSTVSARGEPGRIVDPARRRGYSSLAGPVTTVAMRQASDMVTSTITSDMVMVDVKSMLDLIAHQQQLAELLQPQVCG